MSIELDFINAVNFNKIIETTKALTKILTKTDYFNVTSNQTKSKGEDIMKKYFNKKRFKRKNKPKQCILNIEQIISEPKQNYCLKPVWSFTKFNEINPGYSLENVINYIVATNTTSKRIKIKEEEVLSYLSYYNYNIDITLNSISKLNNTN